MPSPSKPFFVRGTTDTVGNIQEYFGSGRGVVVWKNENSPGLLNDKQPVRAVSGVCQEHGSLERQVRKGRLDSHRSQIGSTGTAVFVAGGRCRTWDCSLPSELEFGSVSVSVADCWTGVSVSTALVGVDVAPIRTADAVGSVANVGVPPVVFVTVGRDFVVD